jgi:hypothetical protein
MRTRLGARGCLTWAQQNSDWPARRRVIDMDRQEASRVVMRVEHRQLLMTMHHIDSVIDIKCHRGGRLVVAGAIRRYHDVHQLDNPPQRGGVLPTRHGRLRTQITPAVRQVAAGQLDGGVTAQMIEVVGIFVATRDGKNAGAQDVGKRVNNTRWVASIGDLRGKLVGDFNASLG